MKCNLDVSYVVYSISVNTWFVLPSPLKFSGHCNVHYLGFSLSDANMDEETVQRVKTIHREAVSILGFEKCQSFFFGHCPCTVRSTCQADTARPMPFGI